MVRLTIASAMPFVAERLMAVSDGDVAYKRRISEDFGEFVAVLTGQQWRLVRTGTASLSRSSSRTSPRTPPDGPSLESRFRPLGNNLPWVRPRGPLQCPLGKCLELVSFRSRQEHLCGATLPGVTIWPWVA